MTKYYIQPEKCLACQMDLLPYIGLDREKMHAPINFCDAACRDVYTKYKNVFLIGREDAERQQQQIEKRSNVKLPLLDLRI